jgi:hypothetical protein
MAQIERTLGVKVRRTSAFISDTARFPSRMSTPLAL